VPQALALESSAGEVAIEQSPKLELGMRMLFAEEFDQARPLLQAEAARARCGVRQNRPP
jgi:hypothetical protein